MFTGVELAVVNRNELGKKREYTLILKIPVQSSGAATVTRSKLLSMNFEVASILATCCDGLIVIQSSWKSKVEQ